MLDASVLIALLDDRDAHHADAVALLSDTPPPYVVHSLTLAEVLVGPARIGVEEQVLNDLRSIGVDADGHETGALVRGGSEESLLLAQLRAEHGLQMPDTCVLAVATRLNAPLATFDDRLADVARRSALLV